MSGELVDDLRAEIDKGHVLAIVGAGVSIGASGGNPLASWIGLLKHGIEYCVEVVPALPPRWSEICLAELGLDDPDSLSNVAHKIARKLDAPDGGRYHNWLSATVGRLPLQNREVIEALRDLGIPLATTNYDDLLEKVTGLPAVTWQDGDLMQQVIRGDEKGILHLHGHWREPKSVVFGLFSYARIIDDPHFQAILDALWAMRTLLFVGCGSGLTDPNFSSLLSRGQQRFRTSRYRHFQLCTEAEKRELGNGVLTPLSYGSSHAGLAAFLRDLPRSSPTGRSRLTHPIVTTSEQPALPPHPRCLGRDTEVQEIVVAVCRQPPLPVPILGPPGAGRTTVALAVLHDERVEKWFGERRWFVSCEGAGSRDELAAKIAQSLGLAAGPSPEPGLFAELRLGPALLVLDDAEIPWEADTVEVEGLLLELTAVEALALVVTLRGGQRPYGLPWREAIRLGPLDLSAAREAFLAVAGQTFRQDPDLNRLLEAVDRLPLAIAMLAHQAEGQPHLKDLRLGWQSQRRTILRRGEAVQPSSLDVSLDLAIGSPRMTREARRLLSLLGSLPDGVAHRDLESLLPDKPKEAAAVLRKVGLAFDQESRLKIFNTVRIHVQLKHPPTPEDLDRAMDHFLALAGLAERSSLKAGGEAPGQLLLDAGNLEAMILLGLERKDAAPAVRAAVAVTSALLLAGQDASDLLQESLGVCRRSGLLQEAASCLRRLGDVALEHEDREMAWAHYEESQALFHQLGKVLEEAHCLRALGDVALTRVVPDLETARARYAEARLLYERAHEPLTEAACLKVLGDIALSEQLWAAADFQYREALCLFRRTGHVLCEALCLRNLGDVALQRTDVQAAHGWYEQALALYVGMESFAGRAGCLRRLGDAVLASADAGTARARYEEALGLYRSMLPTPGAAWCARRLGDIALAERDYTTARELYEEALRLYHCMSNLPGEIYCVTRLMEIEMRLYGELSAEADLTNQLRFKVLRTTDDSHVWGWAELYRNLTRESVFRSSVAYEGRPLDHLLYEEMLHLDPLVTDRGIWRSQPNLLAEAQTRQDLGRAALDRWEYESAQDLYEEAVILFQRLGFSLGEAECLKRLGDIALALGRAGTARLRYGGALELYQNAGGRLGRAYCLRRLGRISGERDLPPAAATS